jgi:hypothetical protein
VGPRACLDDVEKRTSLPYRDSKSDPSSIQPVASRYTDCAIPAHRLINTAMKHKNGGLQVLSAVSMKMKSARSRQQTEQTAGKHRIM